MQICEACGLDEALRDADHAHLPLTEWAAIRQGWVPELKDTTSCYLTTIYTFEEVFQHTCKPPMQLTEHPIGELVYSRSDYDGHRWWTIWHSEHEQKPAPEIVAEIDEFQDSLFRLPGFRTLKTMSRFCRYAQPTDDEAEFDLYSETKHLHIWIRLITRPRDYNVHVHYYGK